MARGKPAIFLDRDGVLNAAIVRNGRPYPPASVDELRFCDGAKQACTELKAAGFALFCVTNQPDVARGTIPKAQVDALNDRVAREMGLDDFETCFHDGSENCDCRKPKPGLLLRLADRHGIDLGRSVMVGDRWRDIEAGENAGCRTVFIDYGYDEKRPEDATLTAASLAEAVPGILILLETSDR
jgi:D-glycero-D-manno-heptose 1,7-bisphosphate phosphatase